MSHLKAAAPASKETDKGRVALAKVGRYWAGKRAPGAEFETDAAAQGHEEAFGIKQSGSDVQRTPVEAAIIVKKADPRLARLAKTDVAEARGEGRQRHRRALAEAEVIRRHDPGAATDSTTTAVDGAKPPADTNHRGAQRSHGANGAQSAPQSSSAANGRAQDDADEGAQPMDEDQIAADREARRQRALQAQRVQEQLTTEAFEEEESEESEYETDSSEDEEGGKLAKPVFVTKAERETIAEREAQDAAAEEAEAAKQTQKAARQKETASMVSEMLHAQREAERAAKIAEQKFAASDLDTSSDEDEAEEEYQAWTRRELARIKREEALRDPAATAADASADAGPSEAFAKPAVRGQHRFLQKYYHKGAFFQSSADDERGTVGGDAIYRRDFTGATGDDRFDKEALPAVMQVKNFGRAGRTKWKHLTAEDTTAPEGGEVGGGYGGSYGEFAPEFQKIRERVERRGAARGADEFDKPRNTRT